MGEVREKHGHAAPAPRASRESPLPINIRASRWLGWRALPRRAAASAHRRVDPPNAASTEPPARSEATGRRRVVRAIERKSVLRFVISRQGLRGHAVDAPSPGRHFTSGGWCARCSRSRPLAGANLRATAHCCPRAVAAGRAGGRRDEQGGQRCAASRSASPNATPTRGTDGPAAPCSPGVSAVCRDDAHAHRGAGSRPPRLRVVTRPLAAFDPAPLGRRA